jgi:hypothetical protein
VTNASDGLILKGVSKPIIRSILVISAIAPIVLIASAIHHHLAVPASDVLSPSMSIASTSPERVSPAAENHCDIAEEDFSNQVIDSDQFGEIGFKGGTYVQQDELGKAEWRFTLTGKSSVFHFGPDVVRIVGVDADHVGGSGYWYLSVGYICLADQLRKVVEISSLIPVSIVKSDENSLQYTVSRVYEGANPPRDRKVVHATWSREDKRFLIVEGK